MSWKAFEESSPELAALGRDLLDRKIVYLARLRPDGAPHLNPVTPFVDDSTLYMFTVNTSPKIEALRRDGRYAMHSAIGREGELVEFLVLGRVAEISDPQRWEHFRELAEAPIIDENYTLFEFLVERVLVVTYDEEERQVIRRWRA